MGLRDAARHEIGELTAQLSEFGLSLTDIADNCPKQERTLTSCRAALRHARDNPQLIAELKRTKKLPISALSLGSGTERKTLERHRKYLIALLLIYSNGYEMIRGHLKQVLNPGKGGAGV
jgi:RNA polymerase sigma factor